MKNLRNFGVATGRLTREPIFFDNRDGSRKVIFTIAAQNDYPDKNGNYKSQFIPLEAFIPAKWKSDGVYAYMNQGDMVSCSYTIQNNNYKDKNGKEIFDLTMLVDEIILLDSKASKEARQAKMAS